MHTYVLGLRQIDKTQGMLVGGKGANLGELCRLEGIRVPDGFCVTTEAFKKVMGESPLISELLQQLSLLKTEDRGKIAALSSEIRRTIEGMPIPMEITSAVTRNLSNVEENHAYAVRSSATAEDLPTASFAGQQDTYLNIKGTAAVITHIGKCWASLFTERAVAYRIQNGFDHRKVQLAVVVQQMVFSTVSGILFTADPVNGNRRVIAIDASFGLGEALVSGRVNADTYKVREGKVIDKKIAAKQLAVYALPGGGTKEQVIEQERQHRQALTDEQLLQLESLGRKIEAHFGCPQDIEWCLAGDTFYIVQSRPVTTLFPIPATNDSKNHVFVSVGHQQMMTDAMKPLGLSVWNLIAGRAMYTAGGRLFVDIAQDLASPARREIIVNVLGKSDPLLRDALTTILEREDLIQLLPAEEQAAAAGKGRPPLDFQTLNEYDPAIVTELISQRETSLAELKQTIQTKTGTALIDFILEDIQELRKFSSNPQSFGVIMTGMNASAWINEKAEEWLGEKNVADTISQSVPNNITSAMGLDLLDVADAIRPYPEVITYLQQVRDNNFLNELPAAIREVLLAFLDRYGMRCAGEIDITRTRWSEKPIMLVPIILNNIKNLAPGASHRKFEQGKQEALKKEQEVLAQLAMLPNGEQKVKETKRMIGLVRNLIGYREYPKYSIVSRYWVYKQALLKEAEQLVQANVLNDKEEIYYLTYEELREVIATHKPDHQLIQKRKEEFQLFEKLTPPRIITSAGEVITGKYKRENLPANALAGLAVSAGLVEGRARVILNMEHAGLEAGDILVTAFTDPSWTPLFVSIKGLVTEVGGLMTHGAVIAREYGLPAVVGVENATRLIKDGQRIRVHGTEGYVELL